MQESSQDTIFSVSSIKVRHEMNNEFVRSDLCLWSKGNHFQCLF